MLCIRVFLRGSSNLWKNKIGGFLYPLYILCLTIGYLLYIQCIYTVRILFDVGVPDAGCFDAG